ncbi:alkylation response protein AidB-like acyl-CoA dehydrogenase [Pullulanibacillus pueri]|uniref:Putative acyl-CoA dehydrogenase YdbM n=1 Tax=Pullulanibacillus pueri TaxID=1437324 RepID=A0A8J3ELF6_9BACL|nr:acyl-CoA dehydrogenase family protein [Pullulanibacillus pueri]MBM7682323.1 alkylation response protein AidB-like acyl-CoA dehydrogenase [Pullulanibacillus pueri]GGH80798.1 putative acyl-CoA dehydrogenase YdbM [Pullulanibacillus pueri]
MDHLFLQTDHERELYAKAKHLADQFRKDAAENDREARFPVAHFQALKEAGYTALTVPESYGGEDISLTEMVIAQEQLAQGDAATALSVGWHLGVVMDLALRREWEESAFSQLCQGIVKEKQLINRIMTEPKTGSPTRGGKPQTTARQTTDGWILNGHKNFSTLSALADWFLVTASIENQEEVGWFLVSREANGVAVEQTWDTMGMRATRSDDVFLKDVTVGSDALVETISRNREKKSLPPAWLLHIPACYLGIALAARHDVIHFAETYQPNSLEHPIKDVPRVRDKIGEIELKLLNARYMLYSVARQWDQLPDKRYELGASLAAAKVVVMNAATEVVDSAMKIVGGSSLNKSLPFERYLRDVRAGLFNPPTEDSVLGMLAKQAFND